MARYVLDSSALVKYYHLEAGTADGEALVGLPGGRLFISRLAWTEVQACRARRVREGALTNNQFDKTLARLAADIAAGFFNALAMSGRRLDAAAAILAAHGLTRSIRTLDAIPRATAQSLHAQQPIAGFVAADRKQLAVADACGLPALSIG
jgi:PIN domain nuclease of toxin-antitoxin system